MNINAVDVPAQSILRRRLDTAYFYDCFEATIKNNDRTAFEIYLAAVSRTPKWIDFLMRVRNRVVAWFGLKDLGKLSVVEKGRSPESYRIGDRVGIFSIVSMTDQEVILEDADKHLSAQISIYVSPEQPYKIATSTVVHVNNWLGRVYLFFVVPVHKFIVPAMLARMVDAVEPA